MDRRLPVPELMEDDGDSASSHDHSRRGQSQHQSKAKASRPRSSPSGKTSSSRRSFEEVNDRTHTYYFSFSK